MAVEVIHTVITTNVCMKRMARRLEGEPKELEGKGEVVDP
jgi:hypothetical protein